MNLLLAITMVVFGTVTGVIGWRRTTKYVYRRSVYAPDIPHGVSRQDHERTVRRRRKSAGASSSRPFMPSSVPCSACSS